MREGLATLHKHFQFFRFRSPVIEDSSGDRGELFWVAESLGLIDFDTETFIKESFFICYFSKGGFSFSDIKELYMDEYEIAVKEAHRVQGLLNPESKKEDLE